MRRVELRAVHDEDVAVFFDHQTDPDATRMAGFPTRDEAEHQAHWAKIRADDTVVTRTVLADGQVAGNVVSWAQDGAREIGYWIAREHWGRGVATRALEAFLAEVDARSLHAHVAAHNTGSIRVLEKCGFVQRGGEDEQGELTFVLVPRPPPAVARGALVVGGLAGLFMTPPFALAYFRSYGLRGERPRSWLEALSGPLQDAGLLGGDGVAIYHRYGMAYGLALLLVLGGLAMLVRHRYGGHLHGLRRSP